MPKIPEVTIGLIGCGKIGEKHLGGYRRLEGVNVILADENPGRAAALAAEFGLEAAPSPEELFKRPGIQGIDLCVPTAFHTPLALKALESGKHVFCEKPLCSTEEEVRQLEAAQKRSGKTVMAGYCYRFHPAHQLVRRVLDDHIIGRVHYASFRLGGRGGHEAWKHREETGGGALLEMMVHDLDLILWYFGPVAACELARSRTLLPLRTIKGSPVEATAEDCVIAALRSASGTEILCQSDLFTPSFMKYFEIVGENGNIFASPLTHFPTIVFCREERGEFNRGNNFFQFPVINFFEKELGQFAHAVRENMSDGTAVGNAREMIRLIQEIRHAGNPAAGMPVRP